MGLNPKESIAFSSPNISCYPIKNQVSGDQSDYDIVDLGNGQIEIIKFKGFEEKTMIIPNKIRGCISKFIRAYRNKIIWKRSYVRD